MSALGLIPAKFFPWGAVVKYGAMAGAGILLLSIGYIKGDGDRNAKWLKTEVARVKAEGDARVESLKIAHGLDLESAANTADALARADEKAKAAKDRADEAEKNRNATRRKNNALYADLKDAQDAAASAGDLAGRGLMPVGVRNQTADRLDAICRRRSSECGSGPESGSKIQDSAKVADDGEDLAGGYPAAKK